MATIQLPYGIASISGKIGNVVFYHQNGKQYARRISKSEPIDSPEKIINLLQGKQIRLQRGMRCASTPDNGSRMARE